MGIYESQSKKSGSAPSMQQLFNAARAACAVDHDKDVVSSSPQIGIVGVFPSCSSCEQLNQLSFLIIVQITWLETLLNASGKHAPGHQPNGHGNGGHEPVPPPVSPPSEGSNVFVNPIFFPSEQSFQQLVKTLDGAKKSLDICVYTITDDHLASAIIRAHERGVKVRIISDNEKVRRDYIGWWCALCTLPKRAQDRATLRL